MGGDLNFYKRFMADIQVKTGHLTPAEFGIYDRLLDHYYATEALLPNFDRCCAIARAMTRADRDATTRVLQEFFEQEGAGFSQKRADEIIAEAQPKILAARANGKNGGRPKRTYKKPTGFQTETQAVTQNVDSQKASQSQSTSIEVLPPSGVQGERASRRCPSGFEPSPTAIVSMQSECPGVDLEREMRKFRDWEFQKPRKDWPAAWRTWMRKAFDDLKAQPTGETNYARSMREKYEVVAPRVAAKPPGAVRENPMDVIEGMTNDQLRIAS